MYTFSSLLLYDYEMLCISYFITAVPLDLPPDGHRNSYKPASAFYTVCTSITTTTTQGE